MSDVSPLSRPRLADKARLKWDRHANEHMLLYPEHGLILNDSAASILQLCDGQATIADIAHALAAQSGGDRDRVETDVLAFVTAMRARGLVTLGDS